MLLSCYNFCLVRCRDSHQGMYNTVYVQDGPGIDAADIDNVPDVVWYLNGLPIAVFEVS